MELDRGASANSTTSSYRSRNKNKFVGVRQRPSGKWVSEIKNTTQKIRMWLGTFDTAEEAAQAYDEAACLLRGTNTRTNFFNKAPSNPALSLKIRNLLNQKRGINKSKTTPTKNTTVIETCPQTKTSSPVCVSNPVIFEDTYKPDLSCFTGGFPNYSNNYDQSCAFLMDFDKKINPCQRDGFEMVNDEHFPDFERMKVERQISASLYAMNGISEYWDNINIHNSNDPFWDISMLCQMYCSST